MSDADTTDAFDSARRLAARRGGFVIDLPRHSLIHIPAEKPLPRRRLVVSFENLAAPKQDGERMPWGHALLESQGWDTLGVMAHQGDFFRHDDLFDAMEKLRDDGFFARFPDVSMYGSSMGGYGACALAGLAPGCTVVAFAPQSSLLPRRAPFDKRYRYSRRVFPWTRRYGDAAMTVGAAGRAYIFFDPLMTEDRLHADRLLSASVHAIRMACPGMGHKLPPALMKLGLLKPVALAALDGRLTQAEFARMARVRHGDIPHALRLAQAASARGRPHLALRALDWQANRRMNWKIRHMRNEVLAKLEA